MIYKLLSSLKIRLDGHQFDVSVSDTGSIYLIFSGTKVRQIRISNHCGRKTPKNCWELRTDAMTSRKGGNRIYSHNSINQLIRDFA